MTSAVGVARATFGQGTGSIWLDDVNYRGTELRLSHCTTRAIKSHNCQNSEDAGVKCGTGSFGKYYLIIQFACVCTIQASIIAILNR